MSEVQQRPSPSPRGRGSPRGGRGGNPFGARSAGARSSRNSNGDANVPYSIEDQSEMGQLKKQYSTQLGRLREMFPDWSTENLLTTLQENNGDLQAAATKISEGLTTPWGEVKNKKSDRSRSKVKEPSSTGTNSDISSPRGGARPSRGGFDARAGGRGRGGAVNEPRNGRPARGRGGAANGGARHSRDLTEESAATTWGITTEAEAEIKSADADGWDNEHEPNEAGGDASAGDIQSGWGGAAKTTSDRITPKNNIIQSGAITSWANILKSKPIPPVTVQKKPSPPKQMPPSPVSQPQAAPEPKEPEPVVETLPAPEEIIAEPQIEPATSAPEELAAIPVVEPELEPETGPEIPVVSEVKEIVPTPSQQPLTEVNLEKIEDTAPPPPTTTQASTIASSVPPLSASSSVAPPPPPPQPTTVTTPRAAHAVVMPKGTPRMYSRRVLDQQEGVVMPSNHGAVEHATLQFGSMGLSGDLDDEDEVEQAETVSQPPQPSPIAQPVTALPPTGPTQLPVSQAAVTEPLPTPRQAPGLPAHPQAAPQQPSQQPQNMTQQHQHMSNQYTRYGNPDSQQQPQAKTYETFGAPVQQQHPVPQPQSQPQTQPQPQPPQSQQHAYAGYASAQLPHQQSSHIGVGVSTTPDQQQYSNYYDRTQPPGFGNVYNTSYMQQGQSQQDAGANQQRASSGLGGAGEALGQIPTSAPGPGQVQQPTSRYGAAQTGEQSSNHGTPSPAVSTIQQTSQPHNPAIQQYPGGIPGYGYQHPYYNQFMHQNYYNHPNPFGKHQGMYAYPQQAYMSPQYSDHSSTPAGLGGFGTPSTQGRESVGLGDYGRMNATASQQQQSLPQHTSGGAYGGTIPNFLNTRGLPEQQQQLGSGVAQQQAAQQGQNDESMKFENKPPTGPSSTPSIAGQPGRPGSATSGANIGPQHGAQTPASMYGSHLNHNLHGQQAQHSQQYGIGQGQSAASQYSMYSGGYPQYGQSSGRHTGTGWGGYGQH